jgi:hypothetical protein
VNPVSWITNPNSHTPVSNIISYFIRGCLVILFNLYNRPHRFPLPEEVKQNPVLKLEIMSKPATEDSYLYVASKKSEAFHKITCKHVATIKEENLIYFQNLEEALTSGRRGCKKCKPEE